MKKKYPKIIFFIKGVRPSNEEQLIAESLGLNVVFRNANYISETGSLEKCDGVAGKVPAVYANAFPTAEDFSQKYADEMEAKYNKAFKAKIKSKSKKEKISELAEAKNKSLKNSEIGAVWKNNP